MKNLNYVASLVQLDLDDYTTHKRVKIIQYAIDCYKYQLRYKTNSNIAVAYLQPNEVLNAPWPKDYEYYTKMAINVGGTLITLTLNDNIQLVRKFDCGVETIEEAQLTAEQVGLTGFGGGYWFAPHWRSGQYVGEMYSMGGGFNELGYFRVDHKNKQFQFANIPQAEIVLEYVADEETNGNTLIQAMDVDPIRKYIHWQLKEHSVKVSPGEKDRSMGLFHASMKERVFLEYGATITDYLDQHYKGIQSSVKR